MPNSDLNNFSPEVPNDSVVIWRFLDLPKFLSILHRQELWFSSPKKFSDPWDGRYPPKDSTHEDVIGWLREAIKLDVGIDVTQRDLSLEGLASETLDTEARLKNVASMLRDQYGISCWHIRPVEPDAFWSLYSDRNYGLAIKSTVGQIKKSLADCSRTVTIGRVVYHGLDEAQPPNGFLKQFFWKRQNFDYEKELRIVVPLTSPQNMLEFLTKPDLDRERQNGGAGIHVDVKSLVGSVVISPLAPKWFEETVREIANRFNKDLNFEPSALRSTPED